MDATFAVLAVIVFFQPDSKTVTFNGYFVSYETKGKHENTWT